MGEERTELMSPRRDASNRKEPGAEEVSHLKTSGLSLTVNLKLPFHMWAVANSNMRRKNVSGPFNLNTRLV